MNAQEQWSDGRPRPSRPIPTKARAPSPFLTGEDARLSTGFSEGFLRWLKFNAVGGIGIAVQLAALALFRSVLHLDYLVATGLAVETAVIHNFLWHERFTWADRPAQRFVHSLARLAKFNTSNGLVSLVGNLLIMRALVGQFHLNYLIANLIAVATCSIVNFLLSDRFVFES
jgi:putative flippase GtrA